MRWCRGLKRPEHGVKQVRVPWARGRSDFTLPLEALMMALVKEMPLRAIAQLVGEHDTKIWRVVHHYVDPAVEGQELSGVEELGIDDTSFRRGRATCRCSATSISQRSAR
jgi:transposase